MTERRSRAVDLHGFALKEFLEFVLKEDPSWIEGAHVVAATTGTKGQVWSGVRCGLRY